MQAEMRAGQQGPGVGTDGIEGDVAEVEQAGKTDDDVQAQRQKDIEDGEIEMRTQAWPPNAATKGRRSRPRRSAAMPNATGIKPFFMPGPPSFRQTVRKV
jgi:hypothetical protein